MEIRTNKKIVLALGIGLLSVLLGVLAFQFQTYSKALLLVGINLIIVGLFMFSVVLYAATTTKPETELVEDERVAKTDERAGNTAFWSDRAWSIGIELVDLYCVTMFVGTILWSLLRWHYSRKRGMI